MNEHKYCILLNSKTKEVIGKKSKVAGKPEPLQFDSEQAASKWLSENAEKEGLNIDDWLTPRIFEIE